MNATAELPKVEQINIVNQTLSHNLRFLAIGLGVHDLKKKTFFAVLAPKTAKGYLKTKWGVGKIGMCRLWPPVKKEANVYTCVPKDDTTAHFPLEGCVLR